MTHLTEADIAMERYATGEDEAFAVVYDAFAPRLYGYLLRQTGRREWAEDLLQQTMIHMHKARARFMPDAQVAPWAFAIARRLLIDSRRRRRREVLVADWQTDPASADASAYDLLRAREVASQAERVLAGLPPLQREAFELLKQEGLTIAEAAQVLGTSVAAIKLRAHRAYQALRVALEESRPNMDAHTP